MFERRILSNVRFSVLCLLMSAMVLAHSQDQSPAPGQEQAPVPSQRQAPVSAQAAVPGQDQVPVLRTTPGESSIKFKVKASVELVGTFEKWHAKLVFKSTDVTTGVLNVNIEADSVHTGSGMKDGKLKGKDFFDVKNYPLITFHSDKIVQTGPNTFDLPGTFTIRGVSKPETVTFTLTGTRGSGSGDLAGTMAFDRRDYGMNKGIPFVTVADRVEVTLHLKVKRISGPPLVFKQ
jgi:polyisoprenoid-binding protein YceI